MKRPPLVNLRFSFPSICHSCPRPHPIHPQCSSSSPSSSTTTRAFSVSYRHFEKPFVRSGIMFPSLLPPAKDPEPSNRDSGPSPPRQRSKPSRLSRQGEDFRAPEDAIWSAPDSHQVRHGVEPSSSSGHSREHRTDRYPPARRTDSSHQPLVRHALSNRSEPLHPRRLVNEPSRRLPNREPDLTSRHTSRQSDPGPNMRSEIDDQPHRHFENRKEEITPLKKRDPGALIEELQEKQLRDGSGRHVADPSLHLGLKPDLAKLPPMKRLESLPGKRMVSHIVCCCLHTPSCQIFPSNLLITLLLVVAVVPCI